MKKALRILLVIFAIAIYFLMLYLYGIYALAGFVLLGLIAFVYRICKIWIDMAKSLPDVKDKE